MWTGLQVVERLDWGASESSVVESVLVLVNPSCVLGLLQEAQKRDSALTGLPVAERTGTSASQVLDVVSDEKMIALVRR